MEKIFKLQKTFTILFVATAILVLIFSLFFLTDFKDLFGLEMKINQDIANFHNVVLQEFNHEIFFFSLYLVVGIALVYLLEIRSKVPDLFALIIMNVFLLLASVFCFFSIYSLVSMAGVYGNLDFSMVAMEGAIEYIPNDRTFYLGICTFIIAALETIAYSALLAISHISYRKKRVN